MKNEVAPENRTGGSSTSARRVRLGAKPRPYELYLGLAPRFWAVISDAARHHVAEVREGRSEGR